MKDNRLELERQERYSPGYGAELIRSYQRRIVAQEAAFFFPHLRSGMNLLDCGCGPSTITVGLAKLVAPGRVTAIDIESSQIEAGRKYASEQGVSNIEFEVNSVYKLLYPNSSFDAVFAHALLQHLKNPVKALTEMYRVLKPGGVIGVRDNDQGTLVLVPRSPQMDKVLKLLEKFMRYSGGDPFVGRRHRELLRQAGFTDTVATASCEFDGTLEATKKRGSLAAELLRHMTETAVKLDWADASEMEELAATSIAWGENPDAFNVITWCEAVGRKA